MRVFRRLFRGIKDGFLGVYRNIGMAFNSATAVFITLSLISVFTIFSMSVDAISSTIEGSILISAKVDYDYEDEENLDEIESRIYAIEGVSEITFYTKDEELAYYIEANSESAEEKAVFEPYVEGDNPFHHAFYVEVDSGIYVSEVAKKIENIQGIDEVNYGGDSTIDLVNALDSIRYGGFALVMALSILAIALISNTIKLTINARSREIAIMRSVGATNGFIRFPFVVEGVIIGIMGAFIPVISTIFGYRYLYEYLGGVWLSHLFVMIEPNPFSYYVAGLLLIIGIGVGLTGSFFSVTRHLWWKR